MRLLHSHPCGDMGAAELVEEVADIEAEAGLSKKVVRAEGVIVTNLMHAHAVNRPKARAEGVLRLRAGVAVSQLAQRVSLRQHKTMVEAEGARHQPLKGLGDGRFQAFKGTVPCPEVRSSGKT